METCRLKKRCEYEKILKLLISAFLINMFVISASAAVYGDADADNVLSANDASVTLQKVLISTYKMPLENKTDDYMDILDVDRDGSLTAADAAYILQKVLISTFLMPYEKNETSAVPIVGKFDLEKGNVRLNIGYDMPVLGIGTC